MSAVALTCPRCGAPLPLAAIGGAFAQCAFCQSAVAIPGGAPPVTPPDQVSEAASARSRFLKAVIDGIQAGRKPYEVLRDAATARLGPMGESDAVARVTLALAHDFEREIGASISKDGNALSRVADAYLNAIVELRSGPETRINLPFLTATPDGPKHLDRVVTAAVIAELASRAPGESPKPPASAAEPAATPKKRGWWPFS